MAGAPRQETRGVLLKNRHFLSFSLRAEDYHQQYLSKGGRFGSAQSAAKGCTDPIRCYGRCLPWSGGQSEHCCLLALRKQLACLQPVSASWHVRMRAVWSNGSWLRSAMRAGSNSALYLLTGRCCNALPFRAVPYLSALRSVHLCAFPHVQVKEYQHRAVEMWAIIRGGSTAGHAAGVPGRWELCCRLARIHDSALCLCHSVCGVLCRARACGWLQAATR